MSRAFIAPRFALSATVAFSLLAFPAAAAETKVDQHDLKFTPDAITINAGDSVRFTDTDHITHNITIVNPDGTADDKGMDKYNEDIVVPFAKAGTYQVHCKIHPMMKMAITVK
ncbi:MAG: cupredoxin domain-containing protein [Proteobacteria bacterium]|nr:cupredoxin domain-containing protein [Pseudomonadota bacterium]